MMTNDPLSSLVSGVTSGAIQAFANMAQQAQNEKKSYEKSLESAKGEQIFKYLLLINVSSLEGFVSLTRVQVEQAFKWSQIVGLAGFGIIALAVIIGIGQSVLGHPSIDAAYLTGLAGILIETISGVFFYLYNRTLQQLNSFHERLAADQRFSVSILANSLISDDNKRNESRAEIAKSIVSSTR